MTDTEALRWASALTEDDEAAIRKVADVILATNRAFTPMQGPIERALVLAHAIFVAITEAGE